MQRVHLGGHRLQGDGFTSWLNMITSSKFSTYGMLGGWKNGDDKIYQGRNTNN